MNNSDQLRKLACQSMWYMSVPTLVMLAVSYMLLIFGQAVWASGAIGVAFGWLAWTTFRSLRYIKRSEDGGAMS